MPEDKREEFDAGLRSSVLQKAADLGVDNTNFVKEALKWQYNWIGIAGAAAFAVVSGSGLPLVLAAGLELIYLSVVPQSSRFRRLVRSWKYAAEKREHDLKVHAMFQELPASVKDRYGLVFRICQDIRANYSRLSSSSQIFVGQMDQRLDALLYSYVRLLHAGQQQMQYLQMADSGNIQRELTQLQNSLDKEVPKVQEINRKRIDILQRRLQKFVKIRENEGVIAAQCSAIEDVLKLIRDQTMTMRDPQEITERLDTLVQDVEQTEDSVREMEAIFDMANSDPGETISQISVPPAPSSTRNRVRN